MIPPGEPKPIIISSIDSFHPIRGLKNKLMTYYEFLKKFPVYQNKVMLIQYVVPISCRGGRVDSYSDDVVNKIEIIKQMRTEIKELVSKI